MNDFSEIENELKKLRPAFVRPELAIRIEKAFREEIPPPPPGIAPRNRSTQANWISLGLGVGLAAAAGFLMLARLHNNAPAKTETRVAAVTPAPNERPALRAGRLVPAGLTEVVYHSQDEGLHFPEGATQPVRRLRYHTRETLRWQNKETGASLRVSYPSEEVVLLPISGQ